MPAERAYLIVSQSAPFGRRTRMRTRAAWSDRAVASRRPRAASHGPVRPRFGQPLPSRAELAAAGLAELVRRHRQPGRHRLGAPGLRHYRFGFPAHPLGPGRPPHRARHAATPKRLVREALPRYAASVAVLATMVISGWFAASGAAAFAQMVQP
jgi:hypothetical protein